MRSKCFILFLCLFFGMSFRQFRCDDNGMFSGFRDWIPKSFSKQEVVARESSWSVSNLNPFASKEQTEKEASSWSASNLNPFASKEQPKKEASSWSVSNLNPFSSNRTKSVEATKNPKDAKENSWIPGYFMSSSSERSFKRELPSNSNWFSNMSLLNMISARDGSQAASSSDQAARNASKLNLTSYFGNWEMPNFNFTSNFTNSLAEWKKGIPKLELNNTSLFYKDWFISVKANHYGNLLNANLTNSTDPTNTNAIVLTTTPSTVQTVAPTNQSSNMNFTTFREKLISVYDNLTYCDHPCKDQKVKKKIEQNVIINGCGPSYFSERQLKMIPYGEYFGPCCNIHDTHYGECGFRKQDADYTFLDCMLNLINRTSIEDENIYPKVRKTFGYALFSMVDMFGCKAYEISQKEVCSCK